MKTRRRHVTLLELLIAMGLTMMIMGALAYFYRQIDAVSQEAEVQQGKLFRQLYVSTRLMDVLPKASPPGEKKTFIFFTDDNSPQQMREGSSSLVFTFDNGIKLDPHFSNQVLGRLFVDRHRRLCLAVLPSPARWDEFHAPPMKCEVLMEDVDSLAFRFYIPSFEKTEQLWKQASMKVKLPDDFPQPPPEGEWRSDWTAAWRQLPALVEITLGNADGKLLLTYPLPNSNFMVVY